MLSSLPENEYQRLMPKLERVHLTLKQVLYQPHEPISYVYFPITGVISLLTLMNDGATIETGMIGKEGMLGLPIFLGTDSTSLRAICQVEGDALRMRTEAFREEISRDGPLYVLLQQYTLASIMEAAQIAACNSLHPIETRAARWLLMIHDRVDEDHFSITHEFIANMLGVRRASVTVVMGTLHEAGLVEYARGQVTISDRQGLEAVTCECYQTIKAHLNGLTGDELALRRGLTPRAQLRRGAKPALTNAGELLVAPIVPASAAARGGVPRAPNGVARSAYGR